MSLLQFNIGACLLVAALCVWSEISRYTAKGFWLSCARAALALTALLEGSWYANDQIAVAQALMNAAMAFWLLVVFVTTQIEAVRRARPHGKFRDYMVHFFVFWRW